MHENYYKNMSEIIQKSLSNIPETYLKLPQDSINALNKSTKAISSMVYPDKLTDHLTEIATVLSTLSKATLSNAESTIISPNALDFLGNIDLQNEHIELTENDCDSINTILKSSNTVDVPVKISKGKIALADFIKTVLIPILAILLPMIQNSYNYKVNSIESQKTHIEELQLQEKQLQNDIEQKEFLENILTELQNFPEYFESLPKVPECPDEAQKPFGEVPESLDEVPSSPADTYNIESITHDVPNNSVADMHKDQ